MELVDPYHPPATAIGPDVAPVARSIWAPLRWFPASLCLAFALIELAIGLLLPGYVAWLLWRFGMEPFELAAPEPGRMLGQILASALLALLAAMFGLAGARAWMRRRWAWAVIATLLSYLLMVAAVGLLTGIPSPRLPARP